MGLLVLPIVNNSDKYQGEKRRTSYYGKGKYTNRNAVKFVIDDITRNRKFERYREQLLGYGGWGINYFLSVEDIISCFNYIQNVYDIEHRGGRRIYHEVFWFSEDELNKLGRSIEKIWNFAYEVSRSCFYEQGFQVIFAIHYDLKLRYHIHFAVNTINYCTGAKLRSYMGDLKNRENYYNAVLQKYMEVILET